MHWLWYIAIYSLTFSTKDSLRKYALNHYDNLTVLFFEFLFAFLSIALAMLMFDVELIFDRYSLIFLGLGVLHGLGTIGKINAMNISLSKTILASKYIIVFPMLLGVVFLHEYQYLEVTNEAGLLRLVAIFLLPFSLYFLRKNHHTEEDTSSLWLLSLFQFFFFHAGLEFLIKIAILPERILLAAFFQRLSVTIVAFIGALVSKSKFVFTRKLLVTTSISGLFISISTFTSLSAISLAPLVLVKPLEKMLTVIITTLVGLFIFGEHRKLTSTNRWGYLLIVIGILFLVTSEVLEVLG